MLCAYRIKAAHQPTTRDAKGRPSAGSVRGEHALLLASFPPFLLLAPLLGLERLAKVLDVLTIRHELIALGVRVLRRAPHRVLLLLVIRDVRRVGRRVLD